MDVKRQLKLLGKPNTYEQELDHLYAKYVKGGRLDALSSSGLTLSGASMRSRPLLKKLARTVRRGRYRLGPVEAREAFLEGKWRTLYRQGLTDMLVVGVVNRIACELTRPYLSPRVYSYIRGRSSWQALRHFGAYLRAHRKQRPDPRERGLFVIKRDVSAYAPSVPVGEGSRIWEILDDAIVEGAGVPADHPLVRLVREATRPVVVMKGEEPSRLERGVPIGSPIQALLLNIYLTSLDRQLDSIPESFYARYGDDIIFSHPRAEVVREAVRIIDESLAELDLDADNDKKDDVYFTGPGRPSTDWPEARTSSQFEYLGCRVSFGGQMGLKRKKLRQLLADLDARLRMTGSLVERASAEERAAVAVEVVNKALDPGDELRSICAPLLRGVINDRQQLEQIDYLVALKVAQMATRKYSPRAFRGMPYRQLRDRFGLLSLTAARNRSPRRRPR